MPDISSAYEAIDLYVEKNFVKPDSTMTKSQFRLACQRMEAIDILKEYLKAHWYEAPASDLMFRFVNEYKRRKTVLKNDQFQDLVYHISKEIFYYFI